jgi:molecular chaperone IbpA
VTQNTYPPYNIEKTGEDAYRITLAVAGFAEDELSIEAREGQLVVTGRKSDTEDANRNILHRGIATRAFERRFQLADHVRAVEARTENGLLHVDLVREVPEALKPRKIEIARAGKAIETQAAA